MPGVIVNCYLAVVCYWIVWCSSRDKYFDFRLVGFSVAPSLISSASFLHQYLIARISWPFLQHQGARKWSP